MSTTGTTPVTINPDKAKALWSSLSKEDYDVGDSAYFINALKDDKKRQDLFNSIKDEFDVGESMQEFDHLLSAAPASKDEQPAGDIPEVTMDDQGAVEPVTEPGLIKQNDLFGMRGTRRVDESTEAMAGKEKRPAQQEPPSNLLQQIVEANKYGDAHLNLPLGGIEGVKQKIAQQKQEQVTPEVEQKKGAIRSIIDQYGTEDSPEKQQALSLALVAGPEVNQEPEMSDYQKQYLGDYYEKYTAVKPAIDKATSTLQHNPKNAASLNDLGDSFNYLGDHNAALTYYSASAAKDENWRALNGIASILQQNGQEKDAIQAWSAAIKNNPQNTQAAINKTYLEVKLGNHKQADIDLQALKAMMPNDPYVHALSYYNNLKLGREKEAKVDEAAYKLTYWMQATELPETRSVEETEQERLEPYKNILNNVVDAMEYPFKEFGQAELGAIDGVIGGTKQLMDAQKQLDKEGHSMNAFLKTVNGFATVGFSGAMAMMPMTNLAFHELPEPVNKALMQPLDIIFNLTDAEKKRLSENKQLALQLGNTLGSIYLMAKLHGTKLSTKPLSKLTDQDINDYRRALGDATLGDLKTIQDVINNIPPDIADPIKQRVTPLLLEKNQLKTQLENTDESFHKHINEKIKAKDEQIQNLITPEQESDLPVVSGTKYGKLVDEKGEPIVFYHGTPHGDFEQFDITRRGTGADQHGFGDYGNGFYFTSDKTEAADYAHGLVENQIGENPTVLEVHLKMDNPFDMRKFGQVDQDIIEASRQYGNILKMPDAAFDEIYKQHGITEQDMENFHDLASSMEDNWGDWDIAGRMKDLGYDGIISPNGEYVVFDASQIKKVKAGPAEKRTEGENTKINSPEKQEQKKKEHETDLERIRKENEQAESKKKPIGEKFDELMGVKKEENDVPLAHGTAESELAKNHLSGEDSPEQESNVAGIESKAEGTTEAELTQAIEGATKLTHSSTGVGRMRANDIRVDEKRFQNRSELDKSKLDYIAKNFNENELDPLVVWKDPKDGQYYLLAGHHRLEGAKLAKREDVPVRVFEGDQKAAIEFAREKSNANRSMEQPLDRAKIYREKRAAGVSKKDIETAAEIEGKNKNYILNLSALNDNGKTADMLQAVSMATDKTTQKETEKIADWIGEARRKLPSLTNAHENEMYDFLMDKNASQRINTKAEFLQKVNSIVSDAFFTPETPLNLKRFKYKGEGEKLYESEVAELKSAIEGRQNEISEIKAKFTDPSRPDYVTPDNKEYDGLKGKADELIATKNADIKSLQKKLQGIYENKGRYLNPEAQQSSLFEPEGVFKNGDKENFQSVYENGQIEIPFNSHASTGDIPGGSDVQPKAGEESAYTPNLKEGEICLAERILTEQKQFSFTGSDKISSAADVAYLFRHLESAASENAFAVLIRPDRTYEAVYLSTGTTSSTTLDPKMLYAAAKEVGADSICFVHNHPSGNLQPSSADRALHGQVKTLFESAGMHMMDSVIINLDSGQFTEFNSSYDDQLNRPQSVNNEVPITTRAFDRQNLYKHSSERTKITSSADAAEFVSKQKRGATGKMGILILNRQNQITRYVLEEPNMSRQELVDKLLYLAGKSGESIILSSNSPFDVREIRAVQDLLKNAAVNLLDAIEIPDHPEILNNVFKSAADEGLLNEPAAQYGDDTISKTANAVKSLLAEHDETEVRKMLEGKGYSPEDIDGIFEKTKPESSPDVGETQSIKPVENGKEQIQVEGQHKRQEAENVLTDKQPEKNVSSPAAFSDTAPEKTGSFDESEPSVPSSNPRKDISDLDQLQGIKFPQLVHLVKQLINEYPRIKKMPAERRGQFVGSLLKPMIDLNPDLFKEGNEGQLIRTLAHEIGHLFDYKPDGDLKRGNLVGRINSLHKFMGSTFGADQITNKEYRNELWDLSTMWRPLPINPPDSYMKYRKQAAEMYADAISVLLNSPGLLEKKAPKFFEAFWNNLDKKKDVRDAYFDLQESIIDPEFPTEQHLESQQHGFDVGKERMKAAARAEKRQKEEHLWTEIRRQMVSKFIPVLDRVAKPDELGVEMSSDQKLRNDLEAMHYWRNQLYLYFQKMDEQIAQKLVDNDLTQDNLGHVLSFQSNMAPSRAGKGNPGGLTPAESKVELDKYINKLNDENPGSGDKLLDIAQDFHNSTYEVMEDAYDAGIFSDQQMEEIVRPNKDFYSTTQIADYIDDMHISPRLVPVKGTLGERANPFHTTMLKMASVIRSSIRNRAITTFNNIMRTQFPNEIQDAEPVYYGDKFSHHKEVPDKELIPYFDRGKYSAVAVDPKLAEMFKREPEDVFVLTKMADKVNKVFKPLVTTWNLSFGLFSNPIRDYQRSLGNMLAILNSTDGVSKAKVFSTIPGFTYDWFKSLAEGFKLAKGARAIGDTGQEMLSNNAMSATGSFYFGDFDPEANEQLDPLFEKFGFKNKAIPTGPKVLRLAKLYNPISLYIRGAQFLSSGLEYTSKVAAYQTMKKKLHNGELAGYYTRNYLGTPNFMDGGKFKRTMNSWFVFSNIIFQGMRADGELATRKSTAASFWFYRALPVIALGTMYAMADAGWFGDDLKKRRKKIGDYDKSNFLTHVIGEDAAGRTEYLRVPMDDVNRLMFVVSKKSVDAMNGNLKTPGLITLVPNMLLPSESPMFKIASAWWDYADGENPKDAFYGGNIINDLNYKAGVKYSFGDMALWSGQQMGIPTRMYDPTKETMSQYAFHVTPILSKMYRSSDTGEREEMEGIVNEIEKKAAQELLDRREKVQQVYGDMVRDHGNNVTPAQVKEYAPRLKELFQRNDRGQLSSTDHDKFEQMEGLLNFYAARGLRSRESNMATQLHYAQRNEAKLKLLQNYAEQEGNEQFKKLIDFLKKYKQINDKLASDKDLKKYLH